MRVLLDENGYVKEWAMPTDDPNVVVLPDGIDVEDIIDQEDADALGQFYDEFESYRIVEKKLAKDEDKMGEIRHNRKLNGLRRQRETECFDVINRSNMWYNTLGEEQKNDLQAWYKGWLDVTDTLVIPEKPAWLK